MSSERIRIGIVTSRTAKPLLERVISSHQGELEELGVEIAIIDLPVPAIGHIGTNAIARMLEGDPRISGLDYILVPGSCPGSTEAIEEMVGVPAYKASRDPGLLLWAIRELIGGSGLSKLNPYEAEDASEASNEIAFTIKNVGIPVSGPPFVIASEIPPETRSDRVEGLACRLVSEGANIVVVGASNAMLEGEGLGGLGRRIGLARKGSGDNVLLLCEAPRLSMLGSLSSVCDGFSLSASAAIAAVKGGYMSFLEDKLVIVGERDLSLLEQAAKQLFDSGIDYVVVDPVVGFPMIDLTHTIERYREARERIGAPLVFSAANAIEEISADTHGMHALLAVIAAELGASIYYVVESSYHGIHSTSEAYWASQLVARARERGSSPRFAGSGLLVLKQASEPVGSSFDPNRYQLVGGKLKPSLDKGYFTISLDYDRGLILVDYYERGNRLRGWAGGEALPLMRAITASVEVSAEHAGYLGYELHKAELALRLGRSYVQDSRVIVAPWERVGVRGK